MENGADYFWSSRLNFYIRETSSCLCPIQNDVSESSSSDEKLVFLCLFGLYSGNFPLFFPFFNAINNIIWWELYNEFYKLMYKTQLVLLFWISELFPSEIFQQKYMLKGSVNNKHVRCTSHVWNKLFLLKQEHVSSWLRVHVFLKLN